MGLRLGSEHLLACGKKQKFNEQRSLHGDRGLGHQEEANNRHQAALANPRKERTQHIQFTDFTKRLDGPGRREEHLPDGLVLMVARSRTSRVIGPDCIRKTFLARRGGRDNGSGLALICFGGTPASLVLSSAAKSENPIAVEIGQPNFCTMKRSTFLTFFPTKPR